MNLPRQIFDEFAPGKSVTTAINANLTGNDFRIKKINAKEEVEFHNKGN